MENLQTATETSRSRSKKSINDVIGLLSSRDGKVRQMAREALVAKGSQVTHILLPMLETKDTITRWEVVRTISEIGDGESIPNLVNLLWDDDSDIAWMAAKGLISIGSETLVPLLTALINYPESVRLRRGAHHVLTALNDEHSYLNLSPLLHALDNSLNQEEITILAAHVRQKLTENHTDQQDH